MRLSLWLLSPLLALFVTEPASRAPRRPMAPARATGATAAPTDCGRCHDAIFDEWQSSAHALAFTDPHYQQALRGKNRPEFCHGCHAPAPVLDRVGRPPRAREQQREHGITCASCHEHQGTVHGPFGAETSAHPTIRDPLFQAPGSNALCRSCHDTAIADVLPLGREFVAAGLESKGQSCVGCHMRERTRPIAIDPASGEPAGPVRKGRSHTLLGPTDAEFCGSAFAFAARRSGGRLQVDIHNRAGHGIPGLVRRREFPVSLQQRDAQGRTLAEHRLVFSSDNRLLADEVRRLWLDSRPGVVALSVRVDHLFDGKTIATVVDQTLEIQ